MKLLLQQHIALNLKEFMFINLYPLFFSIPLILSTLHYFATKFMNKSG